MRTQPPWLQVNLGPSLLNLASSGSDPGGSDFPLPHSALLPRHLFVMASLCHLPCPGPALTRLQVLRVWPRGYFRCRREQVKTGYETQEQRVLGKGSSQEVRTGIFKNTWREGAGKGWRSNCWKTKQTEMPAGGQVGWQGGQQGLESNNENVIFILEQGQ